MAEINPQSGHRARKGTRCHKRSTRIDLTPMVDLGFLLITFFIFTTTLTQPAAMDLIMPTDKQPQTPMPVPAEQTLQLVLNGDETITWFNGEDSTHKAFTHYAASGLRSVIRNKMKQVAARYGDPRKTIVLIKPSAGATYRNIVAVLDEMLINNISHYVLMDGE